jgi:membrane protease YdiL (CAAX protease family)
VVTALIGLALVWLRVRWDSLWPAVLAHNGWNTSVVVSNALA